ncbi:hypothetical protein GGP99_001728 [Salinibacter ruber]|uniref:Uncharacterized protein n=1 Tax=Salinibacter ruber TaxID=146919 RepID=A0AAW5P8H9_9BACT|nr:hypothetical protein [Salinibacter ruber]
MIEKGNCIYDLGDKTVRILDRQHLSVYLQNQTETSCEDVGNTIKAEVQKYARIHPGKVKVISR